MSLERPGGLTTWLSHTQTADVREAGTETSHAATDNAKYRSSRGGRQYCLIAVIRRFGDLRPSGFLNATALLAGDPIKHARAEEPSESWSDQGRGTPANKPIPVAIRE